jgi:hypothetical protein
VKPPALVLAVLLGRLALAPGAAADPQAPTADARLRPLSPELVTSTGMILFPPTLGVLASVPLGRGVAVEAGVEAQAPAPPAGRYGFYQAQLRLPIGGNARFRRSLAAGVTRAWNVTAPDHVGRGGLANTWVCWVEACPHVGITLHMPLRPFVDLRIDFQSLFMPNGRPPFQPIPRVGVGLAWHR